MEDTTRLKLILVGLFLAATALGYFILTQKRAEVSSKTQTRPIQQIESTKQNPTPTLGVGSSATPAPGTLGANTQTKGGQPLSGASSLPATGAEDFLIAVFSTSAAIIGWSLKRFPK